MMSGSRYQFPIDPPPWIRQRSFLRTPTPTFRLGPARQGVPDLQSQLEGLFDAVWTGEANWRFDDRLDLQEDR